MRVLVNGMRGGEEGKRIKATPGGGSWRGRELFTMSNVGTTDSEAVLSENRFKAKDPRMAHKGALKA